MLEIARRVKFQKQKKITQLICQGVLSQGFLWRNVKYLHKKTGVWKYSLTNLLPVNISVDYLGSTAKNQTV